MVSASAASYVRLSFKRFWRKRCEICGLGPSVYLVSWWNQPRELLRLATRIENHFFCAEHWTQAEQAYDDLSTFGPGPGIQTPVDVPLALAPIVGYVQ